MRLLKHEINTISTTALNFRYCHLLQKGERLLAHQFRIAEARELLNYLLRELNSINITIKKCKAVLAKEKNQSLSK